MRNRGELHPHEGTRSSVPKGWQIGPVSDRNLKLIKMRGRGEGISILYY